MSYQVLARKYRPQRFADVVGQQGVTQTLRNAIAGGRLAQSYIFAGARGVTISTLRWDQFVMVTLFGPRRSRSFDLLNAGALRFALSLG